MSPRAPALPNYLSAGRTVTGTSMEADFLVSLSVAVRRTANLPGRVNGIGYRMEIVEQPAATTAAPELQAATA